MSKALLKLILFYHRFSPRNRVAFIISCNTSANAVWSKSHLLLLTIIWLKLKMTVALNVVKLNRSGLLEELPLWIHLHSFEYLIWLHLVEACSLWLMINLCMSCWLGTNHIIIFEELEGLLLPLARRSAAIGVSYLTSSTISAIWIGDLLLRNNAIYGCITRFGARCCTISWALNLLKFILYRRIH